MKITEFTAEHLEQAEAIGRAAYEKERAFNPALPEVGVWPDLRPFAENGLGTAALEGDRLVGYLGVYPPFDHAFRSTDARGVFSPVHANGTIEENRAEICSRLYQEAGRKWAGAGAVSHAVCLYAHDEAAQKQFFELGFGMRCMDGIKRLNGFVSAAETAAAENGKGNMSATGQDNDSAAAAAWAETANKIGYSFTELKLNRVTEILELEHCLDRHMAEGPTFILRPSAAKEEFLRDVGRDGSRFFGAVMEDRVIAYLRTARDGETFLCGMPGYLHITGAYCLPEHRGKGISSGLLAFAEERLKQDGILSLGVDFESINPPAHHFWRKHFQIYTHSLTRRIDEHAVWFADRYAQ